MTARGSDFIVEQLYAAVCKKPNVQEPHRSLAELQALSMPKSYGLARYHVIRPDGSDGKPAKFDFASMVETLAGRVANCKHWGGMHLDQKAPVIYMWQPIKEEVDVAGDVRDASSKPLHKTFASVAAKIAQSFVPASDKTLKIRTVIWSDKKEKMDLPPQQDVPHSLPEAAPVSVKRALDSDDAYELFRMNMGRRLRLFVEQASRDKCEDFVIAIKVQQVQKTKGLVCSFKVHYKGDVPNWLDAPYSKQENEDYEKELRAATGGPGLKFDAKWEAAQLAKTEEHKKEATTHTSTS